MKSFIAHINIMPHKELLDPQGKTVAKNIHHLDIHGVEDVRIGKHIVMSLKANDEQSARELIELSCKKLLTNPITEFFEYQLNEQ